MKSKSSDKRSLGEIIVFPNSDGRPVIQVRFEGQDAWLSQRQIAELFQVSVPTINEHLTHIFDEGEIQPEATIRKFRIVQTEGKRQVERLVDHYHPTYNLIFISRGRQSAFDCEFHWQGVTGKFYNYVGPAVPVSVIVCSCSRNKIGVLAA